MKGGALLLAAVGVACGSRGALLVGAIAPGRPATPPVETAAAPPSEAAAEPGPTGPHAAVIDAVQLSADGGAALTRDGARRVRLWPTLDGSREPLILSVADAQRLSFARRPGGFAVAVIDAAGGGRVLEVALDGSVKTVARLAPAPPLRVLAVVPGAAAVLALGTDHRLELLSDDGRVLASLEPRGFRARELEVAADGRSAILWELEPDPVPDVAAGAPAPKKPIAPAARLRATGSARRLEVVTGPQPALRLSGGQTPLASVSFNPVHPLAASPDGSRVAFFSSDDDARIWTLEVHDLAGGAPRTLEVTPELARVSRLVFLTPTILYAAAGGLPGAWLLDVTRMERGFSPAPYGGEVFAGMSGRIVAPYGTWLMVADDPASGARRYLGYGGSGSVSAAISPAGRRVAWVLGGGGGVLVEGIGGGPRLPRLDREQDVTVTDAVFLDERRLVTLGPPPYGLRVHDVTTGRLLSRAESGGNANHLERDPSGRYLVLSSAPYRAAEWIFEVDPRGGLVHPRRLSGTTIFTGFLRARGEVQLWVVGSDWKWRTVRADDLLRIGAEEEIAPRDRVMMTVDAGGIAWRVRGDELVAAPAPGAAGERTVHLPEGNARLVSVSADGRRVAVVFGSGLVYVLDGASLEPVASIKPGGLATRMSWSAGGERLAVALPSGGLVLDVARAEIVASRCGADFEVRATPPPGTFVGGTTAGICE